MLAILVLACYLASAVWLGLSMYRADQHAARGQHMAGLTLGVVAVVMHFVLLWQTVFSRPALAFTVLDTASLVGLAMAAIALIAVMRRPSFAAAAATLFALSGLAAAFTNEGSRRFVVESHGWELVTHIVLSVLAYALITIGTGLAVGQALLDKRLRGHQPLGVLRVLPSIEALESGMFQAIGAGFAILSLALFSGFVFVDNLQTQHLTHKTVLSCLAWASFAVLLTGRWRFGWRGRTALWWTLAGFALLGLAYFVSKLVLESLIGRHWG